MKYASIILLSLLCLACSHKGAEQAANVEAHTLRSIGWGTSNYMPRATIFQMSGDYADKVGVTLNADGTLAYYPAPTDISQIDSAPVQLADGWWLNRQGLSSRSVFTRWSFAEYAALEKAPSQEEILAAVIPGARITEMLTLPMTLSEAMEDISRCNLYIP